MINKAFCLQRILSCIMGTSEIYRKLTVTILILCLLLFISCNTNKGNLKVSDFITSFILTYINDNLNSDITPKDHIIKVSVYDDSKRYSITVNRYDKLLLSASDTSYFGHFELKGYDVYFYGKQYEEFVTEKSRYVSKRMKFNPIKHNGIIEYDPIEFRISLYQNFKFDEMHSFKNNIQEDIHDLRDLASKYLKVDSNILINDDNEEIFSNVQQIAVYKRGNDSIVSFISSNLQLPKAMKSEFSNKKIFIRFIVTKEGKVKNPEIIRSSGYNLLDSAVLDVVRRLPDFQPAKHRGKEVNSYFAIPVSLP